MKALTQSRRLIDTQVQLKEFLPELRKSSWVSLDTEADSLHSYPEKLCLLQISLPDTDVLIDPLQKLDMTALFKALASRELLIHGSDNDLRLMYAAQQFVPSKIFDTMWAARLLGFIAFGLNDLLSKLLGITLDKGSQKANWTRRPLTDKMAIYALNDSRHLRALADKLRDQLKVKGRTDWHEQICDKLIKDHAAPRKLTPTRPGDSRAQANSTAGNKPSFAPHGSGGRPRPSPPTSRVTSLSGTRTSFAGPDP